MQIPHLELFSRHKYKIILGALLFWCAIGGIVYLTELIASNYFGAKPMDFIEQRQYLLRWLLWLVFTPIIGLLALRINIGTYALHWFVLIHLLLGTALLSIEFLIEYKVLHPMAEAYYQRAVAIDELIIPFLYKYFGYIINYFLIVGAVNMYVYMNSLYTTKKNLLTTEIRNNELSHQLTLAQLQTLKMQIQPHFLFNAHQSIIGLILQQQNDKAALMLTKLSELLRLVIEQRETDLVPLSEELVIVNLYIDIQKIRFNERLHFIQMIDNTCLDINLPYFILQPIIENAVKYGVEQSDDSVEIVLRVFQKNENLIIEVINDGEFSEEKMKHGFGIGLSNLQHRIKQLYNEQASFELSSKENHRILAKLILPQNAK